jgi:RNA polymerase sigma-70 factor (ECF subfamily)
MPTVPSAIRFTSGDPTSQRPGGSGDAQDFEESALLHLDSLAGFALSLARSRVDADDLIQETLLRAFRAWHTFTPGTNCRSWLFTICRNTFTKLRSRGSARLERLLDDEEARPSAKVPGQPGYSGLADLLDRTHVRPAIVAAVDDLAEPHRSVLVLVDLEGQSYEEAAAALDVPVGTVRSRLNRARRHVQGPLLAHAQDMGIRSSGRDARAEGRDVRSWEGRPPAPTLRLAGRRTPTPCR